MTLCPGKVSLVAFHACLVAKHLPDLREQESVMKVYELGSNAYIVKSIKFNNFVLRVKKLGLFRAIIYEPLS
jgi:hypothetical protein